MRTGRDRLRKQGAAADPDKGVSFNVGSKRAVGYFLNDNGTCKVTVVLAEATGDGATPAPPATRVNVSVAPGKSAPIDAGGKALEFVCRASAATMTVRALEETEFARRS